MASTTYTKRTIGANITLISIPSRFKHVGKTQLYDRGGYYSERSLFNLERLAVEGDDGKNSKIVIRHNKAATAYAEDTMIIKLNGYGWDEFEKIELEHQFDNNFFVGVQYTEEQQKTLEGVKQDLINYLYDYFYNNVTGKAIMEAVRRNDRIINGKLQKQEEKLYRLSKVAEALKLVESKCLNKFMDQKEEPYVLVDVDDHTEVMALDEPRFSRWVRRVYIDHKMVESDDGTNNPNDLLNSEDVTNIIANLKANRSFDFNTKTLYLRVAFDPKNPDTIYYDMTNPNREAIKITPEGWSIDKYPPPIFIREKGCLPQVQPAAQGYYDPNVFDRFINLINLKVSKDDADSENLTEQERKLLFTCYVISLFWGDPNIARVILMLHGPEGSAKTFCERLIKLLVDPAAIETMPFPKWNQNLLVQQMANTYLPFYDNVEILDPDTSNAVCRAATGDGFKVRKLYTTNEDYIFKFTRPVGFNGLNLAATRPDLISRGLIIRLAAIDEDNRREEKEIWKEFEELKPQLLAYIFDVLSKTLKIYKENSYKFVKIEKLPRMASFVALCESISRAMGNPDDAFVQAYKKNTQTQTDAAVESDPIADYIIKMVADGEEKEGLGYKFVGSYADLLRKLEEIATEEGGDSMINLLKQKYGGNNNSVLSRKLTILSNTLKARGIIKTDKPHPKTRRKEVTIQRDPFAPFIPSQDENHAQNQAESAKGSAKGSEGNPPKDPFANDSQKTAPFDERSSNQGDNSGAKGSKGSKGYLFTNSLLHDQEPGQSYSIEELISKSMGDKDYFTEYDLEFDLNMLSVQDKKIHDNKSAKEIIEELLERGKIVEIEPGKYKPVDSGGYLV
jgi:hypothetical protein